MWRVSNTEFHTVMYEEKKYYVYIFMISISSFKRMMAFMLLFIGLFNGTSLAWPSSRSDATQSIDPAKLMGSIRVNHELRSTLVVKVVRISSPAQCHYLNLNSSVDYNQIKEVSIGCVIFETSIFSSWQFPVVIFFTRCLRHFKMQYCFNWSYQSQSCQSFGRCNTRKKIVEVTAFAVRESRQPWTNRPIVFFQKVWKEKSWIFYMKLNKIISVIFVQG